MRPNDRTYARANTLRGFPVAPPASRRKPARSHGAVRTSVEGLAAAARLLHAETCAICIAKADRDASTAPTQPARRTIVGRIRGGLNRLRSAAA